MKRLLFSLLLLTVHELARAQAAPPAAPLPAATGHGRLTGTVVDATTKQPIPFATVALLRTATGQPVDGTACDETGRFSLSSIAAGSYSLQISFVGYQPLDQAGLVFTSKGEALALDALPLASAPARLGEVVVTGQKALVEEKVDRTIYHAEQDHTTQGGDATDVLRHVPLLSVDLDGNVSLRGSRNVKVLLNNKPSTITAGSVADALKQLPADQILRVEVITAPSAKYDAEGAGGIINIVTRKDNLQGKTLDVRGSGGLRSANIGLQAGYRVGKMGFSLGGSQRWEYHTPGSFGNTQLTTDPNTGQQALTTQQAATHHRQVNGRYSFGWDFDLDAHNALAATAQLGLFTFDSYQDGLLTQTYQGGTLARRDLRDVRDLNKLNNLDVSLNYTHLFDKPQHEFSLLTLYSRTNATNDYTNTLLATPDGPVTQRLQNNNPSTNQEATVQADYQVPLGPKQLLEVGGKDILRRVRSDYAYRTASGPDGAYQPLPGAGLTNTFRYRQNVAAAYLSATTSLGPAYSLKAGVRYEHTTIGADFQTGETVDLPGYDVLVPSLNFSRKLANGNLLKAAYNRRIQRPSLQFLNPNLQASNPLNVTQGNPLLRPEYTNNYELAYSTTLKGAALNFSTFARTTTGSIQALSQVRGDTIRTSYANLGQASALGGSGYVNVSLGKKVTLTGSADTYYTSLRNSVADPRYAARNQGWTLNGNASVTYAFAPGWSAQAFGFRHGREVLAQGYQGGFGAYSLSVRRTFWDKKASLNFVADNLFSPTFQVPTELASPLLTQHSLETRHMLSVRLGFSYRLGKLSAEAARRPKKEVHNDDLKGAGAGNGGG